ncbi:acyl-CoA dehydrogenase family protein [Pseudooceanicola onchidii]|uniref:acyl-CoA dehydrogenase family protein n=1 Tax=Pseudooceanicola onchidii TaxID=2562279 RepID=UPI0010AA3449|nr:acyl-CoA dehydrogenase family protein [Pseudooceanicola onchidii]
MSDLDFSPEDFSDTARAVMEACATAADLPARIALLAEAGLTGILAPEDDGGMGLALDYAVPVLREAGAGFLAAPLLETMLLARAFAGQDVAAEIAGGKTLATIAWVGEISGQGGVVGRAPLGAEVASVLVFRTDGTAVLVTLGDGAEAQADDSLDLERPEATITVKDVNGPTLDATQVKALLHAAQILRSALILGASEDALKRAADYAQERVQFGKPLSAYQAVQHHLARQCLAVETIRNSIARSLSAHCETPVAAARATFVGSCDLGAFVAENAIQVHGGMGFTWDVPLHRHLRFARTLAAQGKAAELKEDVMQQLLSGQDKEKEPAHG